MVESNGNDRQTMVTPRVASAVTSVSPVYCTRGFTTRIVMGHPRKANPTLNFDILFVSDSLVSNNLGHEVYQSTYT